MNLASWNSISIPGPVIAVFVGWLLGLLTRSLEDRWFGAKLVIDCTGSGSKMDTPDSVYIRLCIRNTKRRTAKDCRAYVVALHEISNGQKIGNNLMYDSYQIPWAGWSFEGRDIPPKVFQYVDLVKFSKAVSGWEFRTNTGFFVDHAAIANRPGTLQFTVTATSNSGVGDEKQINVDYNLDWHSARVYAGA
jgi:hypothetical protein